MDLSKPGTQANLEAAFGGESMANRKYLFFADVAKQLGNAELARLFRDTANQETEHAFAHFRLLHPELVVSNPADLSDNEKQAILSRCLQFHLKSLDQTQIAKQLEWVLDQEGQLFEPRALLALAIQARRAGVRMQALVWPDQDSEETRIYARILHAFAEKLWPVPHWKDLPGVALKAWGSIRILGGFRPQRVLLEGGTGWVQGGEELARQIQQQQMPVPDQILIPTQTGRMAVGIWLGLVQGGMEIPVIALDLKGKLHPALLRARQARLLARRRWIRAPESRIEICRVSTEVSGEIPYHLPEELVGDRELKRILLQIIRLPPATSLLIPPHNSWPLSQLLEGALTEIPLSLKALLRVSA